MASSSTDSEIHKELLLLIHSYLTSSSSLSKVAKALDKAVSTSSSSSSDLPVFELAKEAKEQKQKGTLVGDELLELVRGSRSRAVAAPEAEDDDDDEEDEDAEEQENSIDLPKSLIKGNGKAAAVESDDDDDDEDAKAPAAVTEIAAVLPVDVVVASDATSTKKEQKALAKAAKKAEKEARKAAKKASKASAVPQEDEAQAVEEMEVDVPVVVEVKEPASKKRKAEDEEVPAGSVALTTETLATLPSGEPVVVSTTSVVPSDSPAAAAAAANGGKKQKVQNVPFRRVKAENVTFTDPRLADMSFAARPAGANDYGARASADLIVTRGKGFTKEKNKKKRGSYKGGEITMSSHSIKFTD